MQHKGTQLDVPRGQFRIIYQSLSGQRGHVSQAKGCWPGRCPACFWWWSSWWSLSPWAGTWRILNEDPADTRWLFQRLSCWCWYDGAGVDADYVDRYSIEKSFVCSQDARIDWIIYSGVLLFLFLFGGTGGGHPPGPPGTASIGGSSEPRGFEMAARSLRLHLGCTLFLISPWLAVL